MIGNNIIINKSKAFAIRIIHLYKYLIDEKKEYILSKQLLRSGTSIGANIREAHRGQSKKDFISKMNIALKEAAESEYWLELINEAGYINSDEFKSVYMDCNELNRLLIKIVKTANNNL